MKKLFLLLTFICVGNLAIAMQPNNRGEQNTFANMPQEAVNRIGARLRATSTIKEQQQIALVSSDFYRMVTGQAFPRNNQNNRDNNQ